MAVVGEAHVIVKAITTGVAKEISRAIDSATPSIKKAGRDAGNSFTVNFSKSIGDGRSGVGRAVKDALSAATETMTKSAAKAGENAGRSFKRGVERGSSGGGRRGGRGTISSLFMTPGDEAKARQYADVWASLQRLGMTLQVVFGTLVGSIGDIVMALGSFAGAAGAAISAGVSLGAVMAGIGIGAKLAGMALKGVFAPMQKVGNSAGGSSRKVRGLTKSVKELREEMQQLAFDAEDAALAEQRAAMQLEDARNTLARVQDLPPNNRARREAELAFAEADLAYRRAMDRNNDLQDQLEKGPKKQAPAAPSGGGGQDPYAGLTKSQEAFARSLVALVPKFKMLREAVAKGFLPQLQKQIETMMGKNFPMLMQMFEGVGIALGDATNSVGNFINSARGMELLDSLFGSAETTIRDLGTALANVLEAVLTLFDAAIPQTQSFTGYVVELSEKFKDFVNGAAEGGENSKLAKFFQSASKFAGYFGEVIGNIFGLFKGLTADAVKPGSGAEMFMKWLVDATEAWGDFGKGDKGPNKALKDGTANAITMFQTLGGIFGIFTDLSGKPEIQDFWKKIAGVEEPLRNILDAGAGAAPHFADLLVSLIEIGEVFADSGQVETFFKILSEAAGVLADIFTNPAVKRFMDALGPVIGALLAFGLITKILKLFGWVTSGILLKIMDLTKDLSGVFKKLWPVIKAVFQGLIGFIKIVIILLKFLGKAILMIGRAIASAFLANPVGLIIVAIIAVIAALIYAYKKFAWFRNFVNAVWTAIKDTFFATVDWIKNTWSSFIDLLKNRIEIFRAVVSIVWEKVKSAFSSGIAWIQEKWSGITSTLKAPFEKVGDAAKAVFDKIPKWIEDNLNIGVRAINKIIRGMNKIPKVDIPEIPEVKLAKGGVVAPKPGGTLALVAEAGRAERVEPLDENGLSKRDKVLIEALSGGGTGGINIVVNPSQGMKEEDLAALVSRRLAFELRKGATI